MTLQSSAYMHLAFPSCYGVGNKARLYRDTIIPSHRGAFCQFPFRWAVDLLKS